MQAGFEYSYKPSNEIIAYIERLSEFSSFELGLLGFIVIFVCIWVYYLFPLLYILKKYWDRQREKAKRKIMLKQISMQRTIEDEIEAEIEVTAQAEAENQ